MNLTYNKTSGHIKSDGAVIGRVTQGKAGVYMATLYLPRFAQAPISNASLPDLLALVRKKLEQEKPLPIAKPKRKVAERKKG